MLTQIISTISTWTLQIIGKMGYVGIFILSTIESAGIPIPSEIVLPFSGFLAFSGKFSFWAVVVLATLGNYFGSAILYYIGKSGGRWILEKYGKYVFVSRHDLEVGDRWFREHGNKVVFWGRLLPIVRTFISLPAGITKMNFAKFSMFTLAGALPWNLLLAYVGFKTGDKWEILKKYFHFADYVIVGILLLLILRFIYKKIWSSPKNS